MMNLEIYEKDPRTHTLLNQGVAKVTSGQSSAELETLRYELTNFVCDGQYAEGLSRILSTYLGHLDKPEQPGVWVSGFFGSGKSHLVKMAQYLWTDFEFPDGAKARGLTKLPTGVKDLLKELTNSAKRHGGLHAAAGDLRTEAKDSIRLALLGIIFKSVGLPGDYTRACFQMWLRDEGLEAGVRQFIVNAGGGFEKELTNLYVSDLIAKAILDARHDFAAKPADVKLLLKSQFPPDPKDVSIDDMIARITQAIGRKGKLPYMVVILDEVQQYINDDAGRSKAVQDVKEQCCARLGANFLLIGTGQNALSGTALLQRLQGRFPVTVELQDTDVEQVTREVVLKKKPTAEAGLKKLLEDHSGEIERQLASTKIAFSSRDRGLIVQDYPILPVRRRFWERVLRAVDKAGTGAQLRNQLWVVYDAVKQTAEWELGNVVSGAFIYDASIKSSALKSGTLLQEISETIAKQKKEDDGELRYQICALIFLIGQLPHNNEPLDAGVRADADTLADLLVTDLTKSSAELRKKIPSLLEKLVTSGAIMQVENEYRMQTREGSEWNQMFLEARNKLLNDPGKLASERSQLLRSQCSEVLKKFKLLHGDSKEPRKIELHFGDVQPSTDGSAIPVWVRDGWEVEEKTVLNDARAAGDSTAIVYGYIPKKLAEELKLRKELTELSSAPLATARQSLTGLEQKHGCRREWVWAKLNHSPLAAAIQYLATLASVTTMPLTGGTLADMVKAYTDGGWRADAAVLDALAAVTKPADQEAINTAVSHVYKPWLRDAAELFQKRASESPLPGREKPRLDPVPAGTCVLFADGLRYDVGQKFLAKLAGRVGEIQPSHQFVALPSVTPTSKPAVSPVAGKIKGTVAGEDFRPCVALDGKDLTPDRFRKLLADDGIQYLATHDTGDPSGKAWTEFGNLDKTGHDEGSGLARRIPELLTTLVQRVESLLEAGWKEVRVVTDHGWLLMPKGLPKSELPKFLTATRWRRCAVVKANATVELPCFSWFWADDVRVASPPGIDCFMAGEEYNHGGLSLQECVVPQIVIRPGGTATVSAKIDSFKWAGLRCRVKVTGDYDGCMVDLRDKAADSSTTLANPKAVAKDGSVALVVTNESREGSATMLVLLDHAGNILDKSPVTVGE